MTVTVRFRMVIAQDELPIFGIDQDKFTGRLSSDRRIEASLQAFRNARASTAEMPRRLDERGWARTADHAENGVQTRDDRFISFSEHAHRHARQNRAARTAGVRQERVAMTRRAARTGCGHPGFRRNGRPSVGASFRKHRKRRTSRRHEKPRPARHPVEISRQRSGSAASGRRRRRRRRCGA